MSHAPLTVIGSRPSLIDPLVLRLLNRLIESKALTISGLEVEARVGILCSKSGDRLRLPILSETALPPSSDALAYEFQSDVGKRGFEAIKQHLTDIQKGNVKLSEKHAVFKIYKVTESHTIDEFYVDQGTRVRVTSRADAPGEIQEVICKKRVSIIDVYSGGEDEAFDLRLSVNDEKKIQNFMRDAARMTGKREKKRWSFDLKGFVIDLTEVKTRDRTGDKTCYEVELELKTALLVEQLARLSEGKSHFCVELLTDFVYAVRDLAWGFYQPMGSINSIVHDTSKTKLPEDLVRKYAKTVGDIQPILGDYIYRIIDELKPSVGV
jgi:hypothetical protein